MDQVIQPASMNEKEEVHEIEELNVNKKHSNGTGHKLLVLLLYRNLYLSLL
jgi:hypothetical protein